MVFSLKVLLEKKGETKIAARHHFIFDSVQFQSKLLVELVDEGLDELALGRRRGEQAAHEGLGAPCVVTDHLAAAVVDDLEAELAVALVGLVKSGMSVRATMLQILKILIIQKFCWRLNKTKRKLPVGQRTDR